MKSSPDGPRSTSALLDAFRSDLIRIEAAYRAAVSEPRADRLYERLLRYQRITRLLENRVRCDEARHRAFANPFP
ncbi:MAG: hypothetical protein QNK04_20070 [Myxococcota bacterium]|nr:hypothetical protein [Myxococcota bacterium]